MADSPADLLVDAAYKAFCEEMAENGSPATGIHAATVAMLRKLATFKNGLIPFAEDDLIDIADKLEQPDD